MYCIMFNQWLLRLVEHFLIHTMCHSVLPKWALIKWTVEMINILRCSRTKKKKNGNKLIRKMYVKHKTGLDIGTFECSSRWMLFELWIAESAGCAVMLWYAETWVHLQCVFKYVHYTCNYDTVWSACIWVTQQTCMLHMCEYPLWMHLHKIVCLCVCLSWCERATANDLRQFGCG